MEPLREHPVLVFFFKNVHVEVEENVIEGIVRSVFRLPTLRLCRNIVSLKLQNLQRFVKLNSVLKCQLSIVKLRNYFGK